MGFPDVTESPEPTLISSHLRAYGLLVPRFDSRISTSTTVHQPRNWWGTCFLGRSALCRHDPAYSISNWCCHSRRGQSLLTLYCPYPPSPVKNRDSPIPKNLCQTTPAVFAPLGESSSVQSLLSTGREYSYP